MDSSASCGPREERRPADVGRHRHQDLARLELVTLLRPVQHANPSLDAARRPGKTGDGVRGGNGRRCGGVVDVVAPLWVGSPLEGVEVPADDHRVGRQRAVAGMGFSTDRDVHNRRIVSRQQGEHLVDGQHKDVVAQSG